MTFDWRRKERDFVLIFVTRIIRLISYGMLSVIFFQNLFGKGLTETQASWIQSYIVLGDIGVSLVLTTQADRFGRINTLMGGAALKVITGLCYAQSNSPTVLIIAGIFGVISVSGGEIGPFMPVEQSALSQLVEECTDDKEQVTKNVSLVFGYYLMGAYVSQAVGAALAGFFMSISISWFGASPVTASCNIVRIYALLGAVMLFCYTRMDKQAVEPNQVKDKKVLNCTGIESHNLPKILTLSGLFAIDAFAGAFVVHSYLSVYYQKRYGFFFDQIGVVLFVSNILSGVSGVLSSKLVERIGAMATMIYTHIPSNLFLIVIAFTTNPTISVILLFARFSIAQMAVPARQTYVTLVVSKTERSAANGISNIARSVGLSVGLGLNGYFMTLDPQSAAFNYPFLISGVIKTLYDITLGIGFLWSKKEEKKEQQQGTEMKEVEGKKPLLSQEKIEPPKYQHKQ